MGTFWGFKGRFCKWVVTILCLTVTGAAVAAVPVIPPGYENTRGAAVDLVNKIAYVWTGSTPGTVIKVNLTTLQRVGTVTFDPADGVISFCLIDPLRKYAYFGTEGSPAKIVRVKLSNFQRVDSLTLASGENNIVSGVMDTKGFAYFGTNTFPGKIVRVNLLTFTWAGSLTLGDLQGDAQPAVYDKQGDAAYFGSSAGSQSKVVKLNLGVNNFSISNTLALAPEDDNLRSVFLDTTTLKAYFGANGGRRIVKVDLPSFSRESQTDLIVGGDLQTSLLVNSTKLKEILAPFDIVNRYVKMDLAELKKVDVVNLDLGSKGLPTGLLDMNWGFAYFCFDPQPDAVTQIKIKDLSHQSFDSDPVISIPIGDGGVPMPGPSPWPIAQWTSSGGDASIQIEASPILIGGLDEIGIFGMNATYDLSLSALKTAGNSLFLPLGKLITLAEKPGLARGEVSQTTVRLRIDPKGNPDWTVYEIEKQVGGENYSLALTTTSLTPILEGQDRGKNLNFRVRAKNVNDSYTDYASAISVRISPPEPPTGKLSVVSHNGAEVKWDPAEGATGYTLIASQDADDPLRPAKTFQTEFTSCTLTELIPNTTYFLFVQASNAGGDSDFLSLGSTITLAATPLFRLETVRLNSVRLIIEPNGNPLGTVYEVEKGVQGGAFDLALTTTSLTPMVGDLEAGRHYQFQVRAKNRVGIVTAYAPVVLVDTPPPPITTVDAARAYPVPFRPGNGRESMTFDQMPADSTIRIYSMSGQLVKELRSGMETASWDVKNDSGNDVASGVYHVIVSGSGGEKKFKIVIQR